MEIKWDRGAEFKTVAGSFNTTRRFRIKKNDFGTGSLIKLSIPLINSAARLRDTLAHEMCHAGQDLIHESKEEEDHGETWKFYRNIINTTFPKLLKIVENHDYLIPDCSGASSSKRAKRK
jgi:hypothetical protein